MLSARERGLVWGLGAALLAVFLVVGVLEPALEHRDALRARQERLTLELDWLMQQAATVAVLARRGTETRQATPVTNSESLLGIVDVSLRSAGLTGSLRRIRPVADAVEAELEAVAYEALMRWLGTLERVHGVVLTQLSLDRLETPGRVQAQVRIEMRARTPPDA
jgi:type II secretory pathway component PulM